MLNTWVATLYRKTFKNIWCHRFSEAFHCQRFWFFRMNWTWSPQTDYRRHDCSLSLENTASNLRASTFLSGKSTRDCCNTDVKYILANVREDWRLCFSLLWKYPLGRFVVGYIYDDWGESNPGAFTKYTPRDTRWVS